MTIKLILNKIEPNWEPTQLLKQERNFEIDIKTFTHTHTMDKEDTDEIDWTLSWIIKEKQARREKSNNDYCCSTFEERHESRENTGRIDNRR